MREVLPGNKLWRWVSSRVPRHPLTILRAPPDDFFEAQLFEMQSTVWQWREERRQGARPIPNASFRDQP
jgi:hypothetical protein